MKIGKKLTMGFVWIALLVGIVGYLGFNTNKKISESLYTVDMAHHAYEKIAKLEVIVLDQVHEGMHLLSFEEESCIELFKKLGEDFRKELEETKIAAAVPEIQEKFQAIKVSHEKFEKMFDEVVKAHYAGQLATKEQRHDMHKVWCPVSDEVIELTRGLQPFQLYGGTIEEAHKKSEQVMVSSTRNFIMISILGVFLAIGFGFLFARAITNPITKLRNATVEIGKGDFGGKRVQIKSKDEIGELAASFNHMADEIQKRNEELQTMNEELRSTNEELNTSNEELQSTTEELEASNEELRSINERLESASSQMLNLLKSAEEKQSYEVRYDNPNLVKCWEIKKCTYTKCPSYHSKNLRCWQVVGTHCGGEIQGAFAQKIEMCEKCEVYKAAIPDKTTEVGEIFNNMMHILGKKAKELKEANEELTTSNEELQSTTEELEATNEELRTTQEELVQKEKLAAVGQLASGVGHELRNPLGVISNAVYFIKGKLPEDPKLQKHIAIMEKEIANSNKIISDLLGFSRTRPPAIVPSDMNKVVEDSLEVINVPENIRLVQELESDLPHAMADPDQLRQVFVNLGLNAIQSMKGGGQLKISTRRKDNFVEIEFADTGCGIPEEDMKKLYDPFFTTKARGIGLGLAVTQGIIERHNGAIEVKSEVGKGSTFVVKLPTERKGA